MHAERRLEQPDDAPGLEDAGLTAVVRPGREPVVGADRDGDLEGVVVLVAPVRTIRCAPSEDNAFEHRLDDRNVGLPGVRDRAHDRLPLSHRNAQAGRHATRDLGAAANAIDLGVVVVEARGARTRLAYDVVPRVDADRARGSTVSDRVRTTLGVSVDLERKPAAVVGRLEPLHHGDRRPAWSRVGRRGDGVTEQSPRDVRAVRINHEGVVEPARVERRRLAAVGLRGLDEVVVPERNLGVAGAGVRISEMRLEPPARPRLHALEERHDGQARPRSQRAAVLEDRLARGIPVVLREDLLEAVLVEVVVRGDDVAHFPVIPRE